jgi:hypothetical protein
MSLANHSFSFITKTVQLMITMLSALRVGDRTQVVLPHVSGAMCTSVEDLPDYASGLTAIPAIRLPYQASTQPSSPEGEEMCPLSSKYSPA